MAYRIFSRGMGGVYIPSKGSNLGPLHWGHSLSHWPTEKSCIAVLTDCIAVFPRILWGPFKLFFAFWSLNSFVWRLSTQALLQGGVQRWPRLPLQNICFSVRGGFPSQEEMFLWVSPSCASVCDVTGTLLEFSWRRACCSDTTLFPVFFSTSDVNIWRSVCLSLTPTSTKKRRAGRAEISWHGGWGWDLYVSVLSPLSLEQCLTPS